MRLVTARVVCTQREGDNLVVSIDHSPSHENHPLLRYMAMNIQG
jgi:hypothetical protein